MAQENSSVFRTSSIFLKAGIILKRDEGYFVNGWTDDDVAIDWQVTRPFNILPSSFDNAYLQFVKKFKQNKQDAIDFIKTTNFCESANNSLIQVINKAGSFEEFEDLARPIYGFTDHLCYGIQIVFGKKNRAIKVNNGEWEKKTDWALSYYYKSQAGLSNIRNTILAGEVLAKIEENEKGLKISGQLLTDNKYYRFFNQRDIIFGQEDQTKEYINTNIKGYNFSFTADRIEKDIFQINHEVELIPYT